MCRSLQWSVSEWAVKNRQTDEWAHNQLRGLWWFVNLQEAVMSAVVLSSIVVSYF